MKTFTVNIPALKVFVRDSLLTANPENKKLTEGYLIAVTSIPYRPLLFTVHLITGAVFSRVPLSALVCKKYNPNMEDPPEMPLEVCQPYVCLEGDIQHISYEYLKDYEVICKLGDKQEYHGRYLFTVDYQSQQGLADDPEQFKTHNIIALDSGQIAALPNNMCLFKDGFFAQGNEWPKEYRRQKIYQYGSK